jgi:hypothetical protein
LAPGNGWRYFTLEEITEAAEDFRHGERPADAYFDRIAPRLGYPLIDPDFVSHRIEAPRYEFRSGDYQSFLSTLTDVVACAIARHAFPRFSGHYGVVMSLESHLAVKFEQIGADPGFMPPV